MLKMANKDIMIEHDKKHIGSTGTRAILVCLLLLFTTLQSQAGNLMTFISADKDGRAVVLNYAEGWVRVTPYTDDIIRVQAGPNGLKPTKDEGWAVPKRTWNPVRFQLDEDSEKVVISTRRLNLVARKLPFGLEFRDSRDGLLTSAVPSWDKDGAGSVHKSGTDEHFFGFGLQFHSLDQRGKLRTIKTNADPPTDNGMAHAPDPFFYSTRGYGLFLNSHRYSNFDMCAGYDDEYSFKSPDTVLDYFFIYGPSFRRISELQTLLRGRMTMPPKWGLGFWYRMPSKWRADKIIETAKEFRARQIPCDVIGLEPGWQTHTYPCTYVWNKERFLDPAQFVTWMLKNGFHVNLWEHQWVHQDSPIYQELKDNHLIADKQAMGGAVPDFTLPKTREIFEKLHKTEHMALGVDSYKLDECDGADFTGKWFYPDDTVFPSGMTGAEMHNLCGFLYQQTFQDMFNEMGKRTYLQVRANFAGGQRYPSCIYSDYYQLPQYIRAQATSGFSGFLWCPELRKAKSTDEFLRRAENVFFSPLATINAWSGDESLLPWNAGGDGEAIFRKYGQLRMRLLPYIYSSFRQTYETGLPLVRALVMDYPQDTATYSVDDEFMFGESMLIAPLVSGTSRDVYLPEGTWTDYWTDKVYSGGRKITVDVPADVIPIFVKSGAVIPMAPATNYVGEKPVEELELHVYPGQGSFTLYDDDGVTTDYLKGDYIEVPIKVNGREVKIGKPMGRFLPTWRTMIVKVHEDGKVTETTTAQLPGTERTE